MISDPGLTVKLNCFWNSQESIGSGNETLRLSSIISLKLVSDSYGPKVYWFIESNSLGMRFCFKKSHVWSLT